MSTTRPPATSAATTPSVPVHAQRLDELFDVVDENDRVLRQETRAEVHRQKLLHRSIHVLVFDRACRVFLQKRSLAKDTAPGCWASSCSGHVDAGEDYDQAVVRELAEEIGITVTAPPPAGIAPVPAAKPAGSSCGFTDWSTRALLCCIPPRSTTAAGSRARNSPPKSPNARVPSPCRSSTSGSGWKRSLDGNDG